MSNWPPGTLTLLGLIAFVAGHLLGVVVLAALRLGQVT